MKARSRTSDVFVPFVSSCYLLRIISATERQPTQPMATPRHPLNASNSGARSSGGAPAETDPNIELFTAWFGSAAVAEMTTASGGRPLVAVLTDIVRQWTLTRVPAPRPKPREPSTRACPVMREDSRPPATPPPPSPRRVRAPPQAAIDAAVERAEGLGQKK